MLYRGYSKQGLAPQKYGQTIRHGREVQHTDPLDPNGRMKGSHAACVNICDASNAVSKPATAVMR